MKTKTEQKRWKSSLSRSCEPAAGTENAVFFMDKRAGSPFQKKLVEPKALE